MRIGSYILEARFSLVGWMLNETLMQVSLSPTDILQRTLVSAVGIHVVCRRMLTHPLHIRPLKSLVVCMCV